MTQEEADAEVARSVACMLPATFVAPWGVRHAVSHPGWPVRYEVGPLAEGGYVSSPVAYGSTPEVAIENAQREVWRLYAPDGIAWGKRQEQLHTARRLPLDVLAQVLRERDAG